MNKEELKELKALFKLCRENGINEIKFMGTEIKFGDMPQSQSGVEIASAEQGSDSPYGNFPAGELTPEQLMFYSAGGLPENDPALKEVANK